LFLDFDGTLTTIRPTPEEVTLRGSLRRSLLRLSQSARFFVCIVSGRRQCDIRELVCVPSIRYLGLHGWEGRGVIPISESAHVALDSVKTWAGGLFANAPEVWVEDKGFSVAIHHRGAEEDVPRVKEAIQKVVEPFEEELRIAQAKNVSEVLPRELEDKGAAVRHQLGILGVPAVPIYLGDDLIDEPAFAALRQGITVRIGRIRPTRARYYLLSVGEVGRFLNRLEGQFA
jgi:alpha,alpha-trehalase